MPFIDLGMIPLHSKEMWDRVTESARAAVRNAMGTLSEKEFVDKNTTAFNNTIDVKLI